LLICTTINYPGLKAWVIEQAKTYSKDSVRLMVGALRTMLEEAVREGVIRANPLARLGKFYRVWSKYSAELQVAAATGFSALENIPSSGA